MARQTTVDVGNALGELIAIDWKDRFGGWIEFMRLKVKIDVSKPLRRVVKLVNKDGVETIGVIKNGVELLQTNDDKEESQTNSRDENGQNEYKGKERSCEEESLSISPMDRRNQKNMRDGMGRFKKGGGQRKSRASMDGFRDILEELSLVDVKIGNGWFTWSNNREGANHVKERLDRFLVSEDLIENLPFISTNVDQEARDLIIRVWNDNKCDTLTKMNNIREKLCPWQCQKYRRMKYKINELEKKIGKIFDGTSSDGSLNLLKEARGQLGQLYDEEERYWLRELVTSGLEK
ncbi:hypothetical protein Gohar_026588, partial [Gossypium harknessii]|nr:hypothetical protein [Gossypium harknessii]